MGMVIAHNIAALNVQKNLYTANRGLDKAIEKLSSGYRINTGADAPADLVISEQLRAQTVGLERAVRNTTEAINVISIAEGALNEMNAILKKMKALAIHAANNGITSPDQVAADQAEVDSAIQTLDRIANTTKYSDQFLLNGSKDITYQRLTEVKGTQNNALMNQGLSKFFQIFKRDGYQVSFGFTGAIGANATTNIGKADLTKSAQKAYLEVDTKADSISQVDTNGNLTKGQSFILTGTQGSRQFRFSEGASLSSVVAAIHNVAGSTGVDAALVFNSTQQITQTQTISATATLGSALRGANNVATLYDNYYLDSAGNAQKIVTSMGTTLDGVKYGKNTDGQGNIYIKVTANGGYELYKDSSLSRESLVGVSTTGGAMQERNNSGLSGLQLTLDSNAKYGSVAILGLGGIDFGANNASVSGVMKDVFTANNSVAHGIKLGTNTDSSGKLYFKVIQSENAGNGFVVAYRDAQMRESDVVARSAELVLATANTGSIILNQVWNDEHTASTGLGIHLDVTAGANLVQAASQKATGEIQFKNLAARVFANEYGGDAFIKVQQFEGGLFTYYDKKDSLESATLIDAGGTGVTFQINGQDATLAVNGQQMRTKGLALDLATQDVMAKIVFNEGKVGSTTIAQVGYSDGSVFTKVGVLTMTDSADADGDGFSGLLANAGHNTLENAAHFQGGMQLQLGEGAGDQERTVVSIESMATAVMGRIEVTKQFDPGKAVVETKTLSMQDVMGGQLASLSVDPTLAMRIIDQAINDVSSLRARLGALQSNMLQTNANNLRVAIENITKMESDIRDTDMAAEMTEYTKFQVLSNAGISMEAQANAQSQAVLQLLRG